jgi:flagellar biosynthesis chaperone FliJ
MKKFHFPLDRVLSWRQTQVRLAEAELGRLRAERTALDRQRAALTAATEEARREIAASAATTSAELAALEHYRRASAVQVTRCEQASLRLDAAIVQQTQIVLERTRQARLLEKLRETRLAGWKAAAGREIDQLAEESYLARLARTQTGSQVR